MSVADRTTAEAKKEKAHPENRVGFEPFAFNEDRRSVRLTHGPWRLRASMLRHMLSYPQLPTNDLDMGDSVSFEPEEVPMQLSYQSLRESEKAY
jgi:hypothetical protein